jgi:hypothetical protein
MLSVVVLASNSGAKTCRNTGTLAALAHCVAATSDRRQPSWAR